MLGRPEMLVCRLLNGRRSHRSSTVARSAVRFSTALWVVVLATAAARSMLVSSVVRTTLGTAITEALLLARRLRIPGLLAIGPLGRLTHVNIAALHRALV